MSSTLDTLTRAIAAKDRIAQLALDAKDMDWRQRQALHDAACDLGMLLECIRIDLERAA